MAHSRNAVVADDRLTHPWVRKQAHRAALASVVTVRPIDTHVGAPALFTVTCDCEVLVFVEVRWRWDLCAVTLRARRPRCNNEQCAPDRGSRSPAGARSESYRKIGACSWRASTACLASALVGRRFPIRSSRRRRTGPRPASPPEMRAPARSVTGRRRRQPARARPLLPGRGRGLRYRSRLAGDGETIERAPAAAILTA